MKQLKLSESLKLIMDSKENNKEEMAVKKIDMPTEMEIKRKKQNFIGKPKKKSNKPKKYSSFYKHEKRPKPQAKASVKLKEIEYENLECDNLDQMNNNEETILLNAIEDDSGSAIMNGEDSSGNEQIIPQQHSRMLGEESSHSVTLMDSKSDFIRSKPTTIISIKQNDKIKVETCDINTDNNMNLHKVDTSALPDMDQVMLTEHDPENLESSMMGNSMDSPANIESDSVDDPDVQSDMESPSQISPGKLNNKSQQPVKCKICLDTWLPNRYFHRKHMSNSHNDQIYECKICSFNSKFPDELNSHIRSKHVSKKSEVEAFHKKNILDGIQRQGIDATPYSIVMEDGVIFGRASKSKSIYACEVCGRSFFSKYSLERHVRCHTSEKPYECSVCSFQSSYSEHMRRHITSVHLIVKSNEAKLKCIKGQKSETNKENNGNIKIEQVNLQHSSNSDAKRRKINNKRFECAVCGLKSTHKSDLIIHIQLKHPNAHIESMENRDGSKVHLIVSVAKRAKERKKLTIECKSCSLIFHDSWKYKVHLRSHTGIKPFRCSICSITASSKMTIRDHIHRKHPSVFGAKIFLSTIGIDGSKEEIGMPVPHRDFKCDICQEIFNDNYNLKHHKSSSHPKDLPFLCLICNCRTATKSLMLIHFSEVHQHDSPETNITRNGRSIKAGALKVPSCELCGKLFSYRSQLKIHMMNHVGDKNFCCEHCEYKTNVKRSLESHVKKKHLSTKVRKESSRVKLLRGEKKKKLTIDSENRKEATLDASV